VKTLLELGQLRRGESFFDYGCGHGGDVLAIGKLGHPANGWDPVHAPDEPKQVADVVNLGFVLNVIEDPAERVEALLDAWQQTRRALLVSTLIAGQEAYGDIRTFGDGVITRRDTFQKFFEPAEIHALLEDTLHTEAVPVGLGIYLVFRDTLELHDFLAQRSRRFIDWESLSRRLGLLCVLKAKRDPYDIHRDLLDELPVILRIYVECAARLYGDPREADLIKIHLHSRKLTFHYYRDFGKAPLPELLTRIKIDLKRLFVTVTVIDHRTGPEHQLLFFKERFLPKDHPDRPKMDRLIRPGLTGPYPWRLGGARRVRSCPNRLQAFGGFQRQAPQTRSPRGNHRLRAVEGEVGGEESSHSLTESSRSV